MQHTQEPGRVTSKTIFIEKYTNQLVNVAIIICILTLGGLGRVRGDGDVFIIDWCNLILATPRAGEYTQCVLI